MAYEQPSIAAAALMLAFLGIFEVLEGAEGWDLLPLTPWLDLLGL